ncbi:MAG: aldo/keto reductase [Bacteroidetes bacterium]|jgi:pyridoxine 4-dehydrogenase|nr:aldo/keto reductase [Bacteroidota bacterium]
MRTKELGSTGVHLSAMGFGAMHLSLAGRPDEEDALPVVHHVLDRGVNFIDTADAYCQNENDKHHNERLLHKALTTYEGDTSDVHVATKGGLMRPDGRWTRNGDPDYLRRTIRESVEALGAPIFLWQHHAPDEEVGVTTSMAPVREAVDEGLIRFVGVSNYSVAQIEEARTVVDVVSVQNQYSPWHRRPEEDGVLAYCEQEGLTFLPWSPLGGRSRAKNLDELDAIASVAERHGVSPQQVVLAWLLARSDAILPIPGASRIATIDDSLDALDLSLSDEEVDRIDAATR